EMNYGEILLNTRTGDNSGAFGATGFSSITTSNLQTTGGQIVFDRDQNPASSYYAPGELVLTTTGDSSISMGDGSSSYVGSLPTALGLRSVTWQQDGIVSWDSGAIDASDAELSFNMTNDPPLARSSAIYNNYGAIFYANGDAADGDFTFTVDGGQPGTFYNAGLLIHDDAATSSVMNMIVDNSSGLIDVPYGTLNISGGVTATGGYFTGSGTLDADVTIQDSIVSPGNSPGVLTINGDLDASAGGNTFVFEVYADSNLYDRLIITGEAIITSNNSVNVIQTGQFEYDPNAPNAPYDGESFLYSAIVAYGASSNIEALPTVHTTDDDTVIPGENVASSNEFILTFNRVDGDVDDGSKSTVEDGSESTVEDGGDSTVGDTDDTPDSPVLVFPDDIINVLVSLSEAEQQAYLESERRRKKMKKVNMCVGT
ncbi:MAG: hypothetical protein KJP04_00705, partial [Arenicella sp.]|nr:hypothetical protein [Arenicella sp.]